MIYPFDLRQVGIVVGLLLALGHAVALLQPKASIQFLKSFPRSRSAGLILISIAGVWSFFLLRTIDLGEFASMRTPLLFAVVAAAVLSAIYVPEFLSVRALGMLALLAAEPLLGAAFLRPEVSRLLVVVLAYAWIFLGLFWVGMPFVLRDQIGWVTKSLVRFRAAAAGGLAYGLLLLVAAALFWK